MSGVSYPPPTPITPWPEFNSLQWVLLNNPVSINYVNSNFLMLSGGTLTGPLNAINISMTGTLTTSGSITMSNAGASLNIPSNSLYINSTQVLSSATQLNYLSGVTPGTAVASNALVLDSSSNITGINNLTCSGTLSGAVVNSAQYLLSGVSINLSSITGVTAGTASASKALILDSSLNISGIGTIGQTVSAGGDMHVLTSTSTTARNTIKFVTNISNMEFGSRSGSAGSYPDSMYMYTNGSYKWVMSASTGDTQILSSTDSSSNSTGSLTLSGGLGVVKNIYTTGSLTLNRNGGNINFINGGNNGLIELAASPATLRFVNGYCINVSSGGIRLGNGTTAAASYPLDMGSTAADILISLYGGNYTFGANNSSLILNSGGTGGIKCYYSTVAGTLGTNICNIQSNGNVLAKYSFLGGSGGFSSYNYDTQDRSSYGMGMHMFYDQSQTKARLFCYNYGAGTYGQISIQNDYLCVTNQGNVNIGGANPTTNTFPLYVQTALNYNLTGGYSYCANATPITNSGSSTGSVGFSLFCAARIGCQEVDVFSDRKLKSNIKDLELEDCYKFMKIKAKSYNFKTETDRSIGFIAQEILASSNKEEIANIVTLHPEENAEEYYDEETKILSPADRSFSVKYNNVAVIHHEIIKDLMKKIEVLELKLNKLLG